MDRDRAIDRMSQEELQQLHKKMGTHEFIKYLRGNSNGTGDYTKEKQEGKYDVTEEEFLQYLKETGEI